jgi:hypothetical protein
LASRGLRLGLGASLPAYLIDQVRRAWIASGRSA